MAIEKTIKIKVDSTGAKKNVDSLDRSIDKLDGSANKTNKSFGKLKAGVIAVAAALQVRVIAQYADAFTSVQNQIRQTTKSTEQLAERTGQLLDVANRSRVGFSETAELYTQLTLSTENLNLSTKEQLRLTETIAKSFAVSGKSAAESAGAIRQLGQAFASGALRGDEFNSIAEGAPEIMRALQRSLNMTQGELRDFAATGGITAEILVTSLGKAASVIDDKLNQTTVTLAQSFVIAENNATAFVGASDLVTKSMTAAGRVVISLSENLDVIANTLLVAATVGFGRLSASIILNTVETIKNTVAKTSSATASTALSAALGMQASATVRATMATRAYTVVAAGASRAMGILGGPLGVILTAVSAIALFSSGSLKAAESAETLAGKVDEMASSFSGLNRAQIDVQLASAATKAVSLEIALNKARIEQSKMEELGRKSTPEYAMQVRKVVELGEQFTIAKTKADALAKAGIALNLRGATDQSDEKPKETKKDDVFINTERFRTASLKAELNERLELQRAFNETALSDFASLSEQHQSIATFNEMAERAALERRKIESALAFEQDKEQILNNERLKSEAKSALLSELQMQEVVQAQIFQSELIAIEQEAAEEKKNIARQEALEKLDSFNNYATGALALQSAFGSKSEKANKRVRRVQVGIDTATGISRAFAEHDFFSALAISAKIAANGKKQLDAINSSGTSISSIGAGATTAAAPRQEPIRESTLVIENRGLSEILEELKRRDPQEPIPLEYALRIAASQENLQRVGG